MRTLILYLLRHWRGQLPLHISLWVNLIGLRILIEIIQASLLPDAGGPGVLLAVFALFFHIVVPVWQITGVIRAAEAHLGGSGAMAQVWATQLACLAVLIFALTGIWGVWHSAQPAPPPDDTFARMAAEHASQYSLTSATPETAVFEGLFALGATKAVRAFLAQHPGVTTLHLISDGGNIYEGRGVGRALREAGLATHAPATCASACLLAFIGGTTRSLGPEGRLGFHQYRVEAGYDVPLADPLAEAARDRALFQAAGVAPAFTAIMFDATSNSMWFPDRATLTDAGVLK